MSTEAMTAGSARDDAGLRTLFVTSIFPNPIEPTLGPFHGQLSQELDRLCDLTVLTPHPWFPVLPRVKWLERWQRIGAIPREYKTGSVQAFAAKYPMVPIVSEPIRAWLMYPDLARVAARLHRARPLDVINGLWIYPDGVAAAALARRLRVPLVLTALGCDVNVCLEEPFKRAQIVRAARQAVTIIAVAGNLKERLCREGIPDEKVVVIPNGVDTARFSPLDRAKAAAELRIPDSAHRCLYVGRLAEEKGVETLLDAFAELRRTYRDDVVLYVVGDGPERGLLAQKVVQLQLQDKVILVGAQPHHLIPSWMSACDVVCLPSHREGCPNVVLEAAACGRPVVATRVGGVPDLVRPETGVLVEPASPRSLAQGLASALDTSWTPAAIRASVLHLSWRHTAQQYAHVLHAAAAGRHLRPAQGLEVTGTLAPGIDAL